MKQYHLQNRPNREITASNKIIDILKKGKYVVISMYRNNEPYIVTLSYGFDEEKNALYFHAAKKGLKIDFLKANSNVCATVIEDGGYILDECAHAYKSVVFWGDMHIVNDIDEMKYGINILLNHLEEKKSTIKRLQLKSESYYSKMEILRLDITQIYGKEGQ